METITLYDYIQKRIKGVRRDNIVQDLLDDMEEDKELKGKTAQEIVNRIHWKGCDGAIEALGLLVKSYKQYCKAHNLQREQVSMR